MARSRELRASSIVAVEDLAESDSGVEVGINDLLNGLPGRHAQETRLADTGCIDKDVEVVLPKSE